MSLTEALQPVITMKKEFECGDKTVLDVFLKPSKNQFSVHRSKMKKCRNDTSSIDLNFSIEIKMVEAKSAVGEKEVIERQEESKITFSFGLWNFLDFDAGSKNFDLRNPSISIGLICWIGTSIE